MAAAEGASSVIVIANPTAGGGKAGALIGKVDSLLRSLRVEHEIRVSESPGDMEASARAAATAGARVVAVLGGDGTVSCAANGLMGTEAALAVLPAGTGDDFARTLGARPLAAAIRLLADPKVRRIDVVRVTNADGVRHFVNVAGAGFDSEVNETADGMSARLGGTGTYLAALVKTLSRFSPARFDVEVDGRTWSGDAMLVVIGNALSYGGGMKVTPDALLDDGRMDVCVIGALSKAAFLRAFPRVFRGSHVRHPKVRMLRGARVGIGANRPLRIYADGERLGPLPAIFETVPDALSVVVGPEAKGFV
jgi:diacylglycerol kinase (ATP)